MGKKYLVLTELFLPTKGGTAVWFAEVYRRLGGKDIHILTAAVPGSEAVDASHPNTIHRLELARVPWLRPESLMMYLRLFLRAIRLAATRRFDAIHAGRALPEGLVAWLVARLTGHKVVIYAHGEELTTWGRGAKFKAMRFALRHADVVIANSDFTLETLLDMGVSKPRIQLINPGVDVERFRPGLPAGDLRCHIGVSAEAGFLLSVGRLQRRKGFDAVIRSVARLKARGIDVHYALIGIGEQMQELKALSASEGVDDVVHFLGHVEADELPRWYNACDLFVMPNRNVDGDTEGFGMVFMEAAACGKASIAGRDGGTGSAVLDGITGLRVDGESLDALETALARLLSERQEQARLADAALTRCVSEFSWTAVANKTRAIA
jgi:phosphatidylinositol alpha-1,6-mannosyltransferase